MHFSNVILVVLVLLATSGIAIAQESDTPGADIQSENENQTAPDESIAKEKPVSILLGESPGDIDADLEYAKRPPAGLYDLTPISKFEAVWRTLNNELESKLGLRLGMAYTTLYQRATNGPGRREGAAGDFDLFGRWTILNRDAPSRGTLGFALEDRHRFTTIPPSRLGREVGSLWSTTNGFNDRTMALIQLWWEQYFADDRAILTLGKISPTNYYNVNRASNQNTLFVNRAFSSNPARNFPGNGLGANLKIMATDEVHLSLGFQDMNGRMTHSGFDTFGEVEWLYGFEVDFITHYEDRDSAHYRIGYWYNDKAEDRNDEIGHGIGINIEQPLSDHDGIFFRWGWQDNRSTNTRQIASLGYLAGAPIGKAENVIGLAASWGQPSDRDLDDQYVVEAFYRFQVAPNIQLTPGYQVIVDPTNNLDQDVVGVFSLRFRVVF